MRSIKPWLQWVALVGVLAVPGYAQMGSLSGRVIGPDGERVEGAKIMIDRLDVVTHYEVETNGDGFYRYSGLPVGTYRIAVVIDGTERWSETSVRIPFNETLTKNFNLSGEADTEVTASVIQEAMNAARSALAAENYDEAIRQFRIVVENEDSQPIVFANLAVALEKASRFEESAENYQRAVDLAMAAAAEDEAEAPPEVAQWYDSMAVIYVNARNFEDGIAVLEKMSAIDSEKAAGRFYDVGRVLVGMGRSQEAVDALMKSIAIDDARADAYWQLGLAYYGVDSPAESIPAFERYLELAPDGENADGARSLIEAAKELDQQ